MTYARAVAFLYSLERFGIKLGLDNIRVLLADLGQPQTAFRSIHVAGTNGKGSTCALLASILQQAGFRVGLYTSPHLVDFRERIQVNRKPIPKRWVATFVARHQRRIQRLRATYFEVTTALAFDYFRAAGVDWAVIETGLGGRLDATNVITPAVAVITSIGLEHTEHLGKTITSIAREKAGIIKMGVPVVVGPMPAAALKAIHQVAQAKGSAEVRVRLSQISSMPLPARWQQRFVLEQGGKRRSYTLGFLGSHQIANAACALETLRWLKSKNLPLRDLHVAAGMKKVFWPARFQLLQRRPAVIADVAHNPDGTLALARTWRQFLGKEKAIVVFGCLADKDYRTMLDHLCTFARHFILTAPQTGRARPAADLQTHLRSRRVSHEVAASPVQAYRLALRRSGRTIPVCLTGSHYLVGEIFAHRRVPLW